MISIGQGDHRRPVRELGSGLTYFEWDFGSDDIGHLTVDIESSGADVECVVFVRGIEMREVVHGLMSIVALLCAVRGVDLDCLPDVISQKDS